ncbi:MAG: TonB-dependent receptor [Proteobacteria bacterium]|nr:TonB-dependent receptor [Pseudomonadota bacterium]
MSNAKISATTVKDNLLTGPASEKVRLSIEHQAGIVRPRYVCGYQLRGESMQIRKSVVSAAVGAALTGTTPVVAQDEPQVHEEIVVTATRRAQGVQDIPYNISAIAGQAIKDRGISDLAELTRGIPGLSGPDLGSRAGVNNTIVMRGLNVGDAGLSTVAGNRTVSPVSTYVDDTPMFANFRLVDIERVEVLRGPQGTLYGSGAVGGTLRFITSKPNPEGTTFEFTGGISANAESDESNYEARGVVNLPLSDQSALRFAVAYDHRGGVVDSTKLIQTDASGAPVLADPGNVDSAPQFVSAGDLDEGDNLFAKVAFLLMPTEVTELTFTYLYQREDWRHGTTAYIGGDSALGNGPDSWEDSSNALDTVDRTVDLASLDITHEFGFASFTSSTSFTGDDSTPMRDTSDFYETLAPIYFFYPRMLVVDQSAEEKTAFTQEFRLVSSGDSRVDWVAGLYYHSEDFDQTNVNRMPGFGAWADDPASSGSQVVASYYGASGLTTVGDFIEFGLGGVRPSANGEMPFSSDFRDEFTDIAAFGELTFRPADAWQVTLGARFFEQELDSGLRQTLPFCGAGCSDDGLDPEGVTLAANASSFNDSIFKLNASWDFTVDHMAYLTVSQGFRRGGSNALPLAGPFADPSFPLEYRPDEVLNKELGIKGRFADGNVSFTAAVYHIDWDDIQIETFTLAGFKAVMNGNTAVSKGAEIEVNAQLSDNLNANFGYSYTDARLTDDVAVTTGMLNDGDRLPFVSENQLVLSLDYRRPVLRDKELRFHLDGNYRSDFRAEPNDDLVPANQYRFDGYTLLNASLALYAETWSVQLYAKNLSNESGLSAALVRNADAAATAEFGRRGWLSRPRSIGVRATYRFE